MRAWRRVAVRNDMKEIRAGEGGMETGRGKQEVGVESEERKAGRSPLRGVVHDGAILRWEFERTYGFPVLELVVGILLALSIGLSRVPYSPSYPPSGALWLANITDLTLQTSVILLAMLLTVSLAGSVEEGELRLLLSYPLSRSKVLAAKVGLTFTVFFLIHTGILVGLMVSTIPQLAGSPFPLLLIGGVTVYLLFFTAVSTFIALTSKNLKISLVATLLVCLGISGLNRVILRAYTFLSTVVVTYCELFWKGFHFSSSVEVPFTPVLGGYLAVTILLFAASALIFRFMEV